jgi:hypothetical protein
MDMPISPDSLYQQLGHLISNVPEMPLDGDPLQTEDHIWLGKLAALAQQSGEVADHTRLKIVIDTYNRTLRPYTWLSEVMGIAYRLLALAEVQASSAVQGTFIPAGNTFDGLAAVGKVLQTATHDVLIVDPYMDEKALTTFGVLVPEQVKLRLLADSANVKPSLTPAKAAWVQQYGDARPVEARITASRTLHDRLIIVDRESTYVLGQSLNAFASRSPTSIVKVDLETSSLKVAAYETIWLSSSAMA